LNGSGDKFLLKPWFGKTRGFIKKPGLFACFFAGFFNREKFTLNSFYNSQNKEKYKSSPSNHKKSTFSR